jgi:CHC2 zinc finger
MSSDFSQHRAGPNRPIISPDAIAAVRNAIRLEEVIAERIQIRPSGKVFVGCCPWHQSRSGRSFVVYPDQQSWRCWGCAVGGDVFSFFERFAGISFPAAVRLVAKLAGMELDGGHHSDEVSERISDQTALAQTEDHITEILNAEYLRVSRELYRANRLEVRAGDRLSELSTGEVARFDGEMEFCWAALEWAYAALPGLDAEFCLLAFGKPVDREQFVTADAGGRRAIIDRILDDAVPEGVS